MDIDDLIRVSKAALWEEAKGKLRAMVNVEGQRPSTHPRARRWNEVRDAAEAFIVAFEDNGLHE